MYQNLKQSSIKTRVTQNHYVQAIITPIQNRNRFPDQNKENGSSKTS